ncbi:MAG: hypothetical protein M1818_004592 [Claussenomyces sp. TS43310]|nr:MAG: hypothetical protein M1818_004592 [Claussenomyces sp. TS43310]
MSTAQSRTRSLRKPAPGSALQNSSSTAKETAATGRRDEGDVAVGSTFESSHGRENKSPSRLPVKPGSGGNTATRPPPRSVTTRPPVSASNKVLSTRSRTLTDSTGTRTTSTLQRRSSSSTTQHTRNASTSSISSSRPSETGRNRNASSGAASTASRPPSQSSRDGDASSKQTIGGHTRKISALTASTTLKPPSKGSLGSSAAPRPTFSTLQQHYSPAKSLAPKPATASFLAPPSPSKLPSNVAISTETARLQAELLQLHLLHRESAPVQRAWKESARTKLEARFDETVARHEALIDKEGEQQFKANAVAFREWQDIRVAGWGLDEKVQALDQVLTGVWKVGEAGGRFSRLVRRFERWLANVQDILEARRHQQDEEASVLEASSRSSRPEPVFIEALEPAWKEECAGFRRNLSGWQNTLRHLGSPVEARSSSLAATVLGCRALVDGMLEQLVVMQRVEAAVGRRERDWIDAMCDAVASEDAVEDANAAGGGGSIPVGGAWRRG